jgi:photosystem II stability/assembly factor-like uncharacterized protein
MKAYAIDADPSGDVYIAGSAGYGLPATNAWQPYFGGSGGANIGDGFIAELDPTGTNLIFCTYLGGSGDDQINGIAVRPEDGSVAVTGFTDSPDFPLLDPVQSKGFQGFFKSTDAAATWDVSNSGLTQGTVVEIVINPANSLIVYALTTSDVFKSLNGGASWTPVSNGLGYLGIFLSTFSASFNLLVIDPLQPETLYAGSYFGVYKTINGGTNWTLLNAGLPSLPGLQDLVIDPNAPTTLYAGTSSHGIYKSMDGGTNWSVMNSGLMNLNIYSLLVDPHNSANIYAGVDNFAGLGLYKSADGGTNWTLLTGVASGFVTALGADPARSSIYTIVSDYYGNTTLYSSTNSGTNWTQLLLGNGFQFTALAVGAPSASAPSLTISSALNTDTISWPLAFASAALQSTPTLNPANWQKVGPSPATNGGNLVVTIPMAGTQGYYRLLLTNGAPVSMPALYLGTDSASGQGVLKSTDGGVGWNLQGFAGDNVDTVAVDPANPAVVYTGLNGGRDAFVSTFSPDGQLYSSTYLGGNGLDQGNAIAMDFDGVYAAGSTSSSDFPTVAAHLIALKSKAGPTGNKPHEETGSTTRRTATSATVQHVEHSFPCPTNSMETIYFKTNTFIFLHTIDFHPANSVTITNLNALPAGLRLNTINLGYGNNDIGTTSLIGETSTTPSTNVVVFQFTSLFCTWTKTITFITQ